MDLRHSSRFLPFSGFKHLAWVVHYYQSRRRTKQLEATRRQRRRLGIASLAILSPFSRSLSAPSAADLARPRNMSSSCTLVADSMDDAVQMLLGLLALSSLYAKWHVERPRRPAQVWFMDALKQGSSAAMIHVMNIVLAIGLVDSSETPSDQDQVESDWLKRTTGWHV